MSSFNMCRDCELLLRDPGAQLTQAGHYEAQEGDGKVVISLSDGPLVLNLTVYASLVESGVIVIEQGIGDSSERPARR